MTLTCDKARWSMDGDGVWVAFRVNDRAQAAQLAQTVDKPHTLEVKPERKCRSLDANAYLWVLLDKLGTALGRAKDDLYREYIKEVGIFKDFHLSPEEVPTFREAWRRLGTGWVTEQTDYTSGGDRLVIRAYYGSSQYSTKRMSRLIDRVVQDCQDQGIETKTPDELALMMARWDDAQAH